MSLTTERSVEDIQRKLKILIKSRRCTDHLISLLQSIHSLAIDLNFPALRMKDTVSNLLKRFDLVMCYIGQVHLMPEDLERGTVISKGFYGNVQLVRQKDTKEIFTMKAKIKAELINTPVSFWTEREIMTNSDSPWLMQMTYAFQDNCYLYIVMDYMPGGDLGNCIKNHKLPEVLCQFYAAEILLALDALHSMGFIHRNITPSKFLIDSCGHLKLSDFSKAMKMNSRGMVYTDKTVGTSAYTSPEELVMEDVGGCYGKECDWWTVGVIIYEMLLGELPFPEHGASWLYLDIVNHDVCPRFPRGNNISKEAKNIISSLIRKREFRLGQNDVKEIQQHPFFCNDKWNFDTIRQVTLPRLTQGDKSAMALPIVTLAGKNGNGKFTIVEEDGMVESFSGDHLSFLGFSYFREYTLTDKEQNREATQQQKTDNSSVSDFHVTRTELEEIEVMYEERIRKTEIRHKKELTEKNVTIFNVSQWLQNEICMLKMKEKTLFTELETTVFQLEVMKTEMHSLEDSFNLEKLAFGERLEAERAVKLQLRKRVDKVWNRAAKWATDKKSLTSKLIMTHKELEKCKDQLEWQEVLKTQAVNKLAEVTNAKAVRGPVSLNEIKTEEKITKIKIRNLFPLIWKRKKDS